MRLCLTTLFILGFSVVGFGEAPPLSSKELREVSSLIVKAKVLSLDKIGGIRKDACYGWQDFRAKLFPEKISKGKQSGPFLVLFSKKVEEIKKCVGGHTSHSMEKGEHYLLHLGESQNGEKTYFILSIANIE